MGFSPSRRDLKLLPFLGPEDTMFSGRMGPLGYSDDFIQEGFPERTMFTNAFIFSKEQLAGEPYHPSSFADELVDDLRWNGHGVDSGWNSDLLSLVRKAGPVRLSMEYDFEPDGFEISLSLAETYGDAGSLGEVFDVRKDVESVDSDMVRDESYERLIQDVESADHDPRTLEEDTTLASVAVDRFWYRLEDTIGFVMDPGDPLLITVGGRATPWEGPEQGDWAVADMGHTMEQFYSLDLDYREGDLSIQEGRLVDRIDELSGSFMESFADENDVTAGGSPSYDTLLNYLDLQDHQPAELVALREFHEEDDFSMDSDAEMEKLRYFDAQDDRFFGYLTSVLEDAREDGRDIRAWRLRGLDHCIGDIEKAYQEWGQIDYQRPYKARDLLEDASVNAEAFDRFVQGHEFEEKDGMFLSYLVNDVAAEKIVLPDMSGVDYIGLENEKEILVKGDVGSKLGYENRGEIYVEGDAGSGVAGRMKDGRIDIEGDVRGLFKSVGKNMEGGEVHVRGDCRKRESCEGEVYTYRKRRLRESEWIEL